MQAIYSVGLYSNESKHWPIVTVKLQINSDEEILSEEAAIDVAEPFLAARLVKLGIDMNKHNDAMVECYLIETIP